MSEELKLAISHLKKNDKIISSLIEQVGPCSLTKRKPFESLVKSIVSQQLSFAAAKTIHGRLSLVVKDKITPSTILRQEEQSLRNIGLSKAKTAYLIDLASKVKMKEINLASFDKKENEAIIEDLIKIKGIGKWTAEMFLIFSMNRLNVLPLDDVGIQRAIKLNYNLKKQPTKKFMLKLAKSWNPYCSIASWYLWQSLNLKIVK